MKGIDFVLLADAATIAEGKLNALGFGWNMIRTPRFPFNYPVFGIAFRARVGWNDTNQPIAFALDIVDADEQSLLSSQPTKPGGVITVGRPPQASAGEDQVVPMALTIGNLAFTKAGTYAVVVSLDGIECARSTFQVVAA